jgi:hypothetical protein
LGRAGAARPSPPARPVAPPGPPTRASGSATTTHRGRAPSRGRQPRGGCSYLALQPAPVPTAQPPARGAPSAAWPAWSLSGQAGPPRPAPNPAARVRHQPPIDQRDFGSVARVPASSTVDRAVDGLAATGASTRSGGQGRPATSTWVPTATACGGGDGRVRMDGGRHQTPGHRTGGHRTVDSRRVDSRRPTAGPSGRPSQVTGHRTAGQPDAETGWVWTPHAGHRRPTPWLACWQCRPRRRRLTSRERLDAPPGRRRLGEQQPGPLSRRDAGGTHAGTDGSGPAATVSCRWYAAVQLAPWRTAVLGRFRVERRASGSRSSVMASTDCGGGSGSASVVLQWAWCGGWMAGLGETADRLAGS